MLSGTALEASKTREAKSSAIDGRNGGRLSLSEEETLHRDGGLSGATLLLLARMVMIEGPGRKGEAQDLESNAGELHRGSEAHLSLCFGRDAVFENEDGCRRCKVQSSVLLLVW
jgi:hypothetical protein